MARSTTPINEYDIIAEVCKGGRTPHAESIFKAVEKNDSSFPSCWPQHFWWSSNGSNLCGTWEAIELIEHFVESQSSVRSSRKSKNVNVSYAVWDGSCHKMGETRPHQQQFALRMVTSKDLTNRFDPYGVGRSRMCRMVAAVKSRIARVIKSLRFGNLSGRNSFHAPHPTAVERSW